MPRRYYRRRTVVVRPKKKWASNLVPISETLAPVTGTTYFWGSADLAENKQQSSAPTATILKTGNFKVQGDSYVAANSSGASITSLTLYVVYVPEGIVLTTNQINDYVTKHPEWILAWKFVSCNYVSSGGTVNDNTFSFSSRLKRNLNSGDKIVLYAIANGQNVSSIVVKGQVQFWTCAN